MECSKDVAMLANFVERDWIFEFLSSLNPEHDPIHVQILGKEKLPSLSVSFYTIPGEKSHWVVKLDEKPIDRSTLVTDKKTKLGSFSSSSKPNQEGC